MTNSKTKNLKKKKKNPIEQQFLNVFPKVKFQSKPVCLVNFFRESASTKGHCCFYSFTKQSKNNFISVTFKYSSWNNRLI